VPHVRARDGTRLSYRDEGRGPPVLFVHGWAMSRRFFDAQFPLLAPDHRCVALDLRGCGDSETRPGTHTMDHYADDVADLIQELGLDGVTLVGWSMGGGIAMRYLDRHGPRRLRAVGLVDFPPVFEEDPSIAERVCSRLRTDREKFITSFLKRMVLHPTPESMAWMMAEHVRCQTDTACESYRQLGTSSARGRTYELPALLAFPRQGWYHASLDEWRRIFPRHVAPDFDASRHCPFLEEPEAFAKGVRELDP
jgi:pimeloyl-ACP methyl ester carboxylesterase